MRLFVLFSSVLILWACSKERVKNCEEESLKDLATYPIGAAFDLDEYNPALADKFRFHFNRLTPSNALKFRSLKPSRQGHYQWQKADSLVGIAKSYHARIHGHTLVWHRQNPSWLPDYKGDYKTLLQSHIDSVLSRYRNDIHSWDVVNEALNDDGSLRSSIWLRKLGADYIYLAFKAAADADPGSELFYNDYNLAFAPKKLDAALALCSGLRKRGIDVAGIGMQMHVGLGFPDIQELTTAVEKIWKAGFKVHFSELDVSVNIYGNKKVISNEDLDEQREKFYQVVSVYNQVPRQYQFGITTWGVGDADSWLPAFFDRIDAGLLFDEAYRPKPAYCGFKNALQ